VWVKSRFGLRFSSAPSVIWGRVTRCRVDFNLLFEKVRIDGSSEGPLKGMRMALKDNIAVKDVPMLFGTDMFTDYVPDVDASKNHLMERKVYAEFSSCRNEIT
jgi:hypothetical protein